MTATTIRSARKFARLTLEELADRTDISVSQLSRIERGQREPRLIDLLKIAKVLDLNAAELLGNPQAFDRVEVCTPVQPAHVLGRLDPEIVEFAAQRVIRRLMQQVMHGDEKDQADEAARMVVHLAAEMQRQDDLIGRRPAPAARG